MPALPKRNPARRNQSTTRATLVADHDVEAPKLPTRLWHEQTRAWWRDVWSSPMAPEYDDSDKHGLFALAVLVDDFWHCDEAKLRKEIASEIRQQRQCFGLTPIDRRRLQWEIERTEDAQDRGRKRRPSPPVSEQQGDPFAALRAV